MADKTGITFDVLYKKWIEQVKGATTKKDLQLDSSAMRDEANKHYLGIIKLEGDYLKNWNAFYAADLERLRQGESREKYQLSKGELDRGDEAIQNKTPITINQLKRLKVALLRDLDIDTKSVEIGHTDHGVAMDKARILLEHAPIVEKIGDVGITREQKLFIEKALLAQQAIERAKHSDIVRIKKKLGAATVTDDVLIAYLNSLNEKVELNSAFLMQTGKNGPNLRYELEFEGRTENKESGALTSNLGTRMQKLLEITDDEAMKNFKNKKFAQTLLNIPGSWTYLRRVGEYLSNLIKGKRSSIPDSTHKRSTTVTNKSKGRLKTEIARVKKLRRTTLAKIRRSKVEEPKQLVGLFNVMGLINLVLAREVEAQMGKSGHPPTRLRYQDGRFADSAKLLNLVHTKKNTIAGIYTYMHYPYDVFLPGHRLDNGLRDPRVYIEHGIRAAARTILEGRFPGIVLESD